MATKKKQTNGKQAEAASITVEKKNLAKVGAELEEVAVETAVQGLSEVADGVEDFQMAQAAVKIGTAALAAGRQRHHARAGRSYRVRAPGRVERDRRCGRRASTWRRGPTCWQPRKISRRWRPW